MNACLHSCINQCGYKKGQADTVIILLIIGEWDYTSPDITFFFHTLVPTGGVEGFVVMAEAAPAQGQPPPPALATNYWLTKCMCKTNNL